MKMKNISYKLSAFVGASFLTLALGVGQVKADVYKGPGAGTPTYPRAQMRAANICDPASSQIDLDVNNVRCRLLNGGDMWWDIFATKNARYEVPKVDPGGRSIHSSFASGLWFGGVDGGEQLKTAGQTYRQTGLDFWPGPLDTLTATVSKEDCKAWDKQYSVLRPEITEYISSGVVSENIAKWPGNGDASKGQAQFMAPFFDADGDGIYNTASGDYPTLDPNELGAKPDQMIWWVYNDKGGVHTAYPGGEPIGLEVHALAFAFKTSNELNNMTFYKYSVYNRSSTPLFKTYFGVFTDSDLGGADDDFVGCNMALVDSDGPSGPLPPKRRSFGYTYNADNDDADGSSPGYGATPPCFGIDYFRGPKDENGNELPMSTFMFFTNQGQAGINSDPSNAVQLYRYLRGYWADGQPLTYGQATGRGGTDTCLYAFPGSTDPDGRAPWDETSTPGDRRMVQASGPFTLQPGAVNEVIIGAVWGRADKGDNKASVTAALVGDDKAQVLFDNAFKLANGPEPVNMVVVPGDKKIKIMLEGTTKCERYNARELDNEDLKLYNYKFQGYRIYQVKDQTVSVSNLNDISKAVEILQVDIKDKVSRVINKSFDANTQNVQAKIEIDGENKGVSHVFEVTSDQFSTSYDGKFINGNDYYFICIPYAVADSAVFTKYLPSRTSTKVVKVIPNRQVLNGKINGIADDGLAVTRIAGAGNGGAVLDLDPTSEAEIVSGVLKGATKAKAKYAVSKGPVTINVYNPTILEKANYRLEFTADMKSYVLLNDDTNDTLMMSDTTYNALTTLNENEQAAQIRTYEKGSNGQLRLINAKPLGFSIKVNNTLSSPGTATALENNNNFLEASIAFTDKSKNWLSGFSGLTSNATPAISGWIENNATVDPDEVYSNVLNGTWAPYKLLRNPTSTDLKKTSPLFDQVTKGTAYKFDSIGSYDVVFTSDTTKWSECIVVESSVGGTIEPSEGDAKRMNLRKKDIGYGIGKSKFPGYAINLENGERVNIFFAEASALVDENGADMKWNPTSNTKFLDRGGRHNIYVTRRPYDGCNQLWNLLSKNGTDFNNPNYADQKAAYYMVDWVTVPVLTPGKQLLSTDARVRLRVSKPFVKFATESTDDGVPVYKFNTQNTVRSAFSNEAEDNKNALALINVVPNPYYAYSTYEPDRNSNRIRFTNLPAKATVSIYTSNGMLVRRLTKSDAATTHIEWDLRNSNRIPIATGVYIVHIDCPGIGEKTLKWLGVMRPVDFTNF